VQDEPQAALITGLFGTGKSSVAIEMADVLEQPGLPYAVIDLDWLCWGWAGGAEGSEHRMMLANLAPVMTNYLGAAYLILAGSIPNDRPLRTVASEILGWLGLDRRRVMTSDRFRDDAARRSC